MSIYLPTGSRELIIITFITQSSLKYLKELATILGPQNRTQGRCVSYQYAEIALK